LKTSTKKIVFPVFVLFLGVGVFMLLQATKAPAEKKDQEKSIPFVSVETVNIAPLQLSAKSQGELTPRYETLLVSQVTGAITDLSPKFVNGGLIKKGERLAQIDPFDYEVRLQQANADLANARASFIQERAQGQVAEAEWASISNAKPSDLGLRKPQQAQALAMVKASEAALSQAKKDLERTEIKAPFDAMVKARDVSLGQFISIGSQLGQLMDISVAEVRLPVSQADFTSLIDKGQQAEVDLHGQSYGQSYTWKAQIVHDEGVIDAESRMSYLIAQIDDPYSLIDNTKPSLPFGTFVTADIKGKTVNAARVPRRLFINNKLPLIKENTLHLADVTQLKQDGKFTIVSNGLETGDLLLISTLDAPVEGMPVEWNDAQIGADLTTKDETEIRTEESSQEGMEQ